MLRGSVGMPRGSLGMLRGSVGMVRGSVGMLRGSLGMLRGSVWETGAEGWVLVELGELESWAWRARSPRPGDAHWFYLFFSPRASLAVSDGWRTSSQGTA